MISNKNSQWRQADSQRAKRTKYNSLVKQVDHITERAEMGRLTWKPPKGGSGASGVLWKGIIQSCDEEEQTAVVRPWGNSDSSEDTTVEKWQYTWSQCGDTVMVAPFASSPSSTEREGWIIVDIINGFRNDPPTVDIEVSGTARTGECTCP